MTKTRAAAILADYVKVALVRRGLTPSVESVAVILGEGAAADNGSILREAFDADPSNCTVLTRVRQIWNPSWL